MDLVAYDERERPYLARMLVVGLAVMAALLGALVMMLLRGTPASARDPVRQTTSTAARSDACSQLRASADAVVRDARVLAGVVATQTRVVNDLLAHRITLDQALPQALPDLTNGSQQSVQLDHDESVYAAAAKACSSP